MNRWRYVMDNQLAWIVGLLNDARIGYWVDSGTLLGLVRDGKLLEHDLDIDISIWDTDTDKMDGLMKKFREAGYKIRKRIYLGKVYEVKLIPCHCNLRKIDIKVFSVNNGYAWCPCAVGNEVYSKKALIDMLLQKWWAPWEAMGICYWAMLRKMSRLYQSEVVDMNTEPWCRVFRFRTWLIPQSMLNRRLYHDQFHAWLPEKVDKYLQYRYGDWMIPTRDWLCSRDDRTLSQISPLELGLHD